MKIAKRLKIPAVLTVALAAALAAPTLAPSVNIPAGALAGKYLGAGASATAGVGVGARALIGGVDNSISLQPLSLSGSKGFGASAVISGMVLRFEG